MRSEINLLKHENSVLKAKAEGSDSPAGGAGGGKSRGKDDGPGTVKLRQRISHLEMQLKQKVDPVAQLLQANRSDDAAGGVASAASAEVEKLKEKLKVWMSMQ